MRISYLIYQFQVLVFELICPFLLLQQFNSFVQSANYFWWVGKPWFHCFYFDIFCLNLSFKHLDFTRKDTYSASQCFIIANKLPWIGHCLRINIGTFYFILKTLRKFWSRHKNSLFNLINRSYKNFLQNVVLRKQTYYIVQNLKWGIKQLLIRCKMLCCIDKLLILL